MATSGAGVDKGAEVGISSTLAPSSTLAIAIGNDLIILLCFCVSFYHVKSIREGRERVKERI